MNIGITPEDRENLRLMLKNKELAHKFLKDQREYYNERGDIVLESLHNIEMASAKSGLPPYKNLGHVYRELIDLSEKLTADNTITMSIFEALTLNQIETQEAVTTLLKAYEHSAEREQVAFGKLYADQQKLQKDVKSFKRHGKNLTWLEKYLKHTESETVE